jgi:hypothetical protein
MSKEKEKAFKYVENKHTKGVIEQMREIAKNAEYSLNGYVGKLFKKHIKEQNDNKE